ncbi:hypothetical protein [Methylorubrum aminovorans]
MQATLSADDDGPVEGSTQCFYEIIATGFVNLTHSAQVPVEVTLVDEGSQRRLFQPRLASRGPGHSRITDRSRVPLRGPGMTGYGHTEGIDRV